MREVEVDPNVLRVAAVDAHVQIEFRDARSGAPILLYVGYWGRENIGMGHGPEVCFPAAGWRSELAPTTKTLLLSGPWCDGTEATVALHRFSRNDAILEERLAVGFTAVFDGAFAPTSRGRFLHRPPRAAEQGFAAHVIASTPIDKGDAAAADARVLDFLEVSLPEIARCLFHEPIGSSSPTHSGSGEGT